MVVEVVIAFYHSRIRAALFEWTMSKKMGRSRDDDEEKAVHCIDGLIHGVEKRVPNKSALREPRHGIMLSSWRGGTGDGETPPGGYAPTTKLKADASNASRLEYPGY